MKKNILYLVLILVLLSSCSKKIDSNNLNEQTNFVGVIEEVYVESILIIVDEGEDELKSSDLIMVSLDVEIENMLDDYEVGDRVRVYYDGEIAETYPAQINKVYAIVIEEVQKE